MDSWTAIVAFSVTAVAGLLLWRISNKPSRGPAKSVEHQFFAKAAGVSYRNSDRTSRQKIIKEDVYGGMGVTLKFEEGNKHDPYAVALFTKTDKQFGYLDSHLAADIRKWHADGALIEIRVEDVTGGDGERPTLGVNLRVTIFASESSTPSA